MRSLKVADFMIKDVVTIRKEARIADLLRLLVENRIGGVPVVDENNKLVTMISDGDVLRFLQPHGRTIYDMLTLIMVSKQEDLKDKLEYSMLLPVERMIRKKEIYSLHPDDGLDEAVDILARRRFKKIPVVDEENRVVGVISRGDIIRYISTQLLTD